MLKPVLTVIVGAVSLALLAGYAGSSFQTPPAKGQKKDGQPKVEGDDKPMTEEEARTALINMCKRYPWDFGRPSTEELQAATIFPEDNHVLIRAFHCYLDTRKWVFGHAGGPHILRGEFYKD